MVHLWGLNAIVPRGEKSATAFNLLVSFRLGNFLSTHRSPEHLDTWTYAIGDSSRAICIERKRYRQDGRRPVHTSRERVVGARIYYGKPRAQTFHTKK